MPKFQIPHDAGQPLPSDLKEFLARYFRSGDLERLERLGGRVTITVTAPYTDRARRRSGTIAVDEVFVQTLQTLKDRPDELKERLSNLSVAELRKLSGMVGLPTRSRANAGSLRAELLTHFGAARYWQQISGTAPDANNPTS